MSRPPIAWTALAVLVMTLAACAPSSRSKASPPARSPATSPAPAVEPLIYGSVQVADQGSEGRQIVVARTELHGVGGFVVVHDEDQGGPDNVLGWAVIAQGVTTNVVVMLDHASPTGAYWAMLHRDAGQIGVFEWPGPDGPVRAPTGIRYAQKRFAMTVDP